MDSQETCTMLPLVVNRTHHVVRCPGDILRRRSGMIERVGCLGTVLEAFVSRVTRERQGSGRPS